MGQTSWADWQARRARRWKIGSRLAAMPGTNCLGTGILGTFRHVAGLVVTCLVVAGLVVSGALTACSAQDTHTQDASDDATNDAATSDDATNDGTNNDLSSSDAGKRLPPQGTRTIRGGAYFFDATGPGAIQLQKDVTGATAYLLDYPDVATPVAADGSFALGGLGDGEYTVAVVHPDYFPSLSPILVVAGEDVHDVNFQVVTRLIAVYLGAMMGFDPTDPTQCQMVVTVTAIDDSQNTWWAPGEPGATASVDPPIGAEHGPFYFNTSTVPDKTLALTTKDGGVLVAGATPGTYTWQAHKPGATFGSQRLRCVGGWLTNAVPPHGLQRLVGPP